MENNFLSEFINQLKLFIKELNDSHSTSGTIKFLEKCDYLDKNKIVKKFLTTVEPKKLLIQNRDISIFNEKFSIIPGINLSNIWNFISDELKTRTWNYLQLLYIYAELIIQEPGTNNENVQTMFLSMMQNSHTNNTDSKSNDDLDKFNPYEGVGENNVDFSVDDLLTGSLPEEKSSSNFDLSKFMNGNNSMFNPQMLAQMVGLGNNIDMTNLNSYFTQISPEAIEQAKQSIKSILDTQNDNTSKLFSGMLDNITSELSNIDLTQGNPMENLFKIAHNVADKIKSSDETESLNFNDLLNTTQKLTQNLTSQYESDKKSDK